ncbi:MAG: Crp/Fnr family transcriptional regulator [Chitinophagaceae bacterium]
MNTDLLLQTLRDRHHFPDEAFRELLSLFENFSLSRNELFFAQGSVVNRVGFVLSGCLRQYHISPGGDERNIFFAEEGWWCGEMDSFIYRTPSTMSMQAVENCTLIYLSRKNWEYATRTIPDYAMYQIKNRGRTVAWLKNLLSNMTNETPDEKYRRILKENPHWINRLPQYHIASYLGVSPETLSRIRKRNMHL